MTTFLAPVKPGQLITADLFNLLIQKITELQSGQGQIPPGSVIVPLVFGQTLENAIDILGQPAAKLNIGVPIDAFGNIIDPDLPESLNRVVLGQNPGAGSYAQPGSAVDLVLSAIEGSGGGPSGPAMSITGFSPSEVPIKQQVVIIGTGFAEDRYKNEVTFEGIPAGVPTSQSTTTSLFVLVPEGIPDAPTLPGQKKLVKVIVKAYGQQASDDLTIVPALTGENPHITGLTDTSNNPSDMFLVGDTIVINGTNFADPPSGNTIRFDTTAANLNTAFTSSTTQLFVTAPNLPGHSSSNPVVDANIIVSTVIGGVLRNSNPIPVTLGLP